MGLKVVKRKIPWAKPVFWGKEKEYLADALDSTWISGGYYIDKFEKEFARSCDAKYGITTSNGTTALQLAILALGIGSGDEVIVPGFTFVAPVNMIIESGAIPVYADVHPSTWCLDPSSLEKHITNKTKAIIPVHVYGNVCDMDPIMEIANRHHLMIIEDTAEAAFSQYNGRYAGTFGDVGCFSFQATKTITMGEGGSVLTNKVELYEKMRLVRDHGMRKGKRYWHDVVGYNFRLTNLQAAVGYGQLENLTKIVAVRQQIHRFYSRYLKDVPGITMQSFAPQVDPVVWAVVVKIDPRIFKGDRGFMINYLLEKGIETRPGFYPFGVMPLYNAPKLPVSEGIGLYTISLPSFPSLTEEEIQYICASLKELVR